MVEAQVRLLLALVPARARVDPGRMAEAFHAPARAVVERNRPVLERVGRRYRLGVVSNFTGNLAPCLDELGLARLFTAVSDSAVVGAAKPDPRIFLERGAGLGEHAGRGRGGGEVSGEAVGGEVRTVGSDAWRGA